MKAEDIATKAAALISGDRAATHGDKRGNFANIAALWNPWLEMRFAERGGMPGNLTGTDVAKLMALLKIARMESGNHNYDDFTDACGYAAIAGELSLPEETKR